MRHRHAVPGDSSQHDGDGCMSPRHGDCCCACAWMELQHTRVPRHTLPTQHAAHTAKLRGDGHLRHRGWDALAAQLHTRARARQPSHCIRRLHGCDTASHCRPSHAAAGTESFVDTQFVDFSRRFWPGINMRAADLRATWRRVVAQAQAQPPPIGTFHGRGVVIVSGGPLLESAVRTVLQLQMLKCTLPVEIWALRSEITAAHEHVLAGLSVLLRYFDDVPGFVRPSPIPMHTEQRKLFQLKPLAVLHSSFEHVLLLDSDNSPVVNPEYLFDSEAFKSSGAVFWPDLWKTHADNPIWRIMDVAPNADWEMESGQLLVSKPASWTALVVCVHLNSPTYYQLLNGDKDTFRFAWMATSTSVTVVQHRVLPVGVMKPDGEFCGHSLMQHDPSGNILFVHHNQFKKHGDGRGQSFVVARRVNPGFDGRVHAVHPPAMEHMVRGVVVRVNCVDLRGVQSEKYEGNSETMVVASGLDGFEARFADASARAAQLMAGTEREK